MLDTLEFWRVEMLLKDYEEYLEEEKKQHEEQRKEQEKQQKNYQQPNISDVYKNIPKFDGWNNSNMPKVNIPNISMPNI